MPGKPDSTRRQINKFFKQKASRGVDEDGDLYDHTSKLAKKIESDEEDYDQVEVGQKRLRPEIELDQLVYGGKKVSKQQLEASSESELSEEGEEAESEILEGIESDDHESEIEEESEPIGTVFNSMGKTKELDEALEALEDDVEAEKVVAQQNAKDDLERSKAVQHQKKLWDVFLQQRILLQAPLQQSFKLPQKLTN